MAVRVLEGCCLATLAALPAGIAQTCVTSPPYWNLRDYGAEGQIGMEASVEEYVAKLVSVFSGVRRVLRDDGTLWLNLGDTTRNKQLLGIPWEVAFALRADGWFLRSAIVWAKPNPMPESVRDRPTSAYEMVFLLSKRPSYFYDAEAIAEPATPQERTGKIGHLCPSDVALRATGKRHGDNGSSGLNGPSGDTRNCRNVWTIATQPFSGSHFATMPPLLAERCIKAGSSERGQCPHCGSPWARQTSRGAEQPTVAPSDLDRYGTGQAGVHRKVGGQYQKWLDASRSETTGWAPSCACPPHQPVPQVVIDPFGGAGTTALVADRLQRDAILCELNPEYARLARLRLLDDAPLLSRIDDDETRKRLIAAAVVA